MGWTPPSASNETSPLQLTENVLLHHPVYNACCWTLSRAREMAADDKRSPTLDSAGDLPRSPSSPSHLTHFKPLTPDQDEPPFKSAYSSFVNLFRFSKGKCLEEHVYVDFASCWFYWWPLLLHKLIKSPPNIGVYCKTTGQSDGEPVFCNLLLGDIAELCHGRRRPASCS